MRSINQIFNYVTGLEVIRVKKATFNIQLYAHIHLLTISIYPFSLSQANSLHTLCFTFLS